LLECGEHATENQGWKHRRERGYVQRLISALGHIFPGQKKKRRRKEAMRALRRRGGGTAFVETKPST